ncbi:DUF1097 domain-containing protein [Metaclostridioides mangenotii]|uniref:DUF1097 domain-containing protein n=1 Tax=Metaclostridioides mangenotii TaxID=1540 RepID=UPI0028EF9F40|nr:DUF1097 domain-containing protein [Clostridioides mangenotii]
MKTRKKEILTLSLGIAFLPPLWAVLAPYIGVSTGSVALICAGIYVTNGNKQRDGMKIMLGLWCGDLWSVLSILIMESIKLNENLELFLTLSVLGFIAVVIASALEKIIFLPSWLCGWAIGLTIMATESLMNIQGLSIQIAVAMAVGVWYVGAGVDLFTKFILKR